MEKAAHWGGEFPVASYQKLPSLVTYDCSSRREEAAVERRQFWKLATGDWKLPVKACS